jgi:hypothetical protein
MFNGVPQRDNLEALGSDWGVRQTACENPQTELTAREF